MACTSFRNRTLENLRVEYRAASWWKRLTNAHAPKSKMGRGLYPKKTDWQCNLQIEVLVYSLHNVNVVKWMLQLASFCSLLYCTLNCHAIEQLNISSHILLKLDGSCASHVFHVPKTLSQLLHDLGWASQCNPSRCRRQHHSRPSELLRHHICRPRWYW